MLGSRLGEAIDRQECVLRMNHAPTAGYEEDVGARSTIRVVSHTSVPLLLRNQPYFFQQSQETLYIIWGPAKKMNREKVGLTYRALLKVMETYPHLQIYTLTEEKMMYCDDVFQNETGKNREKNHSSVPYHYFEKGQLDECRMYLVHERAHRAGHRFITEKAIFSRWAKRRNIIFNHPSWAGG
ncbi:alpha-N-acetyl-neuraminyl-2,3-beta-galactosyl-1,3-N-acetyl-galactosaminide alpha-2,6-sialyltransferase isoform X3 [Gavia stellata]|uniref:alpha-N-acetyl-neuraminyl-2,3-beta-galactosyl-1, 3-N-acetyl-galactosaminide alpha-2,6-sialyltransferase isoform X3 n=1 Tax=Gavia stellata TaxID=37040 RepID=UPI002898F9F8|nr:alpha-N-acetyl-neuraminyl-2,3-beta-galactosyl-1,3-N-acetyl-galactosaminide alpha-2,6-sialyltransferase isoform X3 [Gavia stellata]